MHSHWPLNEISGNAKNKRQPSGIYDLSQIGIVPAVIGGGKFINARGPFSTINYFSWAAGASSATIYDTNNFAISFWVKTAITGAIQVLVSKSNGLNVGFQISVVATTGKISFVLLPAAPVNTTGAIINNKWTHVLCCNFAASGAGNQVVYINGTKDATTGSGSTWTKSTNDLIVGIYGDKSGGALTGQIDDIVYFSSLPSTLAEMDTIAAQLYAQGRGKTYGYSPGFIQKSTISSVSGSKLITATRLTRQDATNQNPIIYQRNAVIV